MNARLPMKRSEPLSAPAAFDRICDLRDGREARRVAALGAFDAKEKKAEEQLRERVPAEQRARLDVMIETMPVGELDGIGGFGTDPGDSAALLELRQIIDGEIGWRDPEQEEAADYPARIREIAAMLPRGPGADDCRPPLTTTGDTSKPLESWKDSADDPSERTTDDVLDVAPTEATTKATEKETKPKGRRAAAVAK